MKAAQRWKLIAWTANAVCLAVVVAFLAYHFAYGPPRFEPEALWIIGGVFIAIVAPLAALVAALVGSTVSSLSDEREPPSAMSEAEFHEKLRELEDKSEQRKPPQW